MTSSVSPTEPTVSYLICTTPRSGSWLLCDGLFQTELAGYPQEYLLSHTVFDEDWGKPTRANFSAYLEWVRGQATTPNGVCGLKVHWAQLQYLLGVLDVGMQGLVDRLSAELPGLVLIRLERQDKLRQALSYQRAIAQQHWWQLADEPRESGDFVPDLEQVAELLRLLQTHETKWDSFASCCREPALALTYEQLAADLAGTLCRTLLALGVDAPTAWSVASAVQPRLKRQSDHRTDLWVHQYISRQRARSPQTN